MPAPASPSLLGSIFLASEVSLLQLVPTSTVPNQMCEKYPTLSTTLIGGKKQMIVWNDLEADEKVKVYDKGVKITSQEGVYELLVSYRSGDMWAPQLEQGEALRRELSYFVNCISNGQEPFNNGSAGLRIVRMLEGASESLRKRGSLVYL